MQRGGESPTLRDRLESHTFSVLLGITALSLLLRFDGLGTRVAHWDEGRVSYDVLTYAQTGLWEYRPIVHGPFYPRVNELVFSAIGPSDLSMRLVVALVGGLLPLAPWLFRRYFEPLELIAIALLLALNPILLYYSRFMRNAMLVTAFMMFSLGMLVRFEETRKARYLYAFVLIGVLGFTTKANAIVFVVCWLGAGTLVATTALLRPYTDETPKEQLRRLYEKTRERAADAGVRRRVGYYSGHFVLAALAGLLLFIYFYAPRTAGAGIGFERLLSRPDLFPAVAERAITDYVEGVTHWTDASESERSYDSLEERGWDYFVRFLYALGRYSPVLAALSLVGIVGQFVTNAHAYARARPAVMFFAYWGLVSIPGYSIGMDIWAAWALVYALVPLAFPAGVALAWLLEWALEAVDSRSGSIEGVADASEAVVAVTLVALIVGSMLVTVGATAYDPTNTRAVGEDHMVQFAQPSQDVRETLTDMDRVIEITDEPVVFYGEAYAMDNESAAYRPPPRSTGGEDNSGWYDRLPLPWYLEKAGAETQSAWEPADIESRLEPEAEAEGDQPAVIITEATFEDVDNEAAVDEQADEYHKVAHEMRSPGRETVFYLRSDLLEEIEGEAAWEPVSEAA